MTGDEGGPVADPATSTTTPAVRRATGTRRSASVAPARRAPPPRPGLTSELAPPVRTPEPPRPRAAAISAVLWFAACAAGGFGLLAAMMDGAALRAKLEAAAAEADPTASAQRVDSGVDTTILLVLGVVALLVVVTLVGAALLLRKPRWSRWLLLVTGLMTLAAGAVAQSVVTGGVDLDRIGFLVQVGLVVPALVTLFLRSTRAWLRGRGG
jgi:hypothetical protein